MSNTSDTSSPRFMTLAEVAEVLNTTETQVYAVVRRGELPAIKIGGRGQWRVERTVLETFIDQMYAQTTTFVSEHPFTEPLADTGDADPTGEQPGAMPVEELCES